MRPVEFQFHEGPIKTDCTDETAPNWLGFNSMKVRLKHQPVVSEPNNLVSFNSMKVRLKQQANTYNVDYMRFQFHEGPIKTLRVNFSLIFLYCFNSMKVRLKHG